MKQRGYDMLQRGQFEVDLESKVRTLRCMQKESSPSRERKSKGRAKA